MSPFMTGIPCPCIHMQIIPEADDSGKKVDRMDVKDMKP